MKEVFFPFSQIVAASGVEVGVTVRSSDIIASTDKDTRQLASLVIATCDDLLTRFPWRNKIGDDPWVLKADGTYSYQLHDDTDIPLFDGRTVEFGTQWRYLYAKGLTYGETFRYYEKRINDFGYFYNEPNVKVDLNVTRLTSATTSV